MTANDSKSYLCYLNDLVDGYNSSYHDSTDKRVYLCWLSCFDWRIWIKSKATKFKAGEKLHWKLVKRSIIDWFCVEMKANPWKYKIKDLNRKK